jgi:UrcA family protein
MTMIRLSPLALAGAVLATSLTIGAVPSQAATSARVSYADLDLTSSADRAVFDQRLRGAASRVCFGTGARMLSELSACRAVSLTNARAAANEAVRHASVQVAQR